MYENSPSEGGRVGPLVLAAIEGDRGAAGELVARYSPTLWAVARAHRLSPADAADVVQNTWLAFHEKAHTIRDREAVAGWLATTARRESLRLLAGRRREIPVEELREPEPNWDGPEPRAVLADRDRTLWHAFGQLPERCQQVLRLLAHSPELTAEQVGTAVGLAPGSIAKTRLRCLRVLRRKAALAGLFEECAS
ncbi:RNA polymerase sigma factor [Kutzneria albida]|uniref:RNA polymerase sigma-70 region 2 domain-containing protein n=1 Tax=Kutzneria albida DSM 43870 TaxID=1449976 RepID=W5WKN7_9PSEU|nr:sigma-70 family RNA polymerase sigma factor [Kutzneria albida]AHI01769.1 hypothetical protein KALB_8412 [Kutzneria albida DSM 43870]